MAQVPIYTIGYGNRSIEEFIRLLQRYAIEFLVDVRSHPRSRFNSDFSREALERQLKQHNIRYVFMGDTLGGRPSDDTCYVDGRVDYSKLREKPFYQSGINRLHTAWEKQLHVAVMCSEAKPQECHRGKLIGNTLIDQHISVAHIDEVGGIKKQDEINQMLTDPGPQPSLFDLESLGVTNGKLGFSRKKYPLLGEKA